MLSPTDGQPVASTTTPLTFSGFHYYPNQPVRIEAFDFGARDFRLVQTTMSSSDALHVGDGPLYAWSATHALGPEFWEPRASGNGGRARVRSSGAVDGLGDAQFISVGPDWGSCWSSLAPQTRVGFYETCRAASSPEAEIVATNYVAPVWGIADLHTHPGVHRAFRGDGLFWGNPGLTLSTRPELDLAPCRPDTHAAGNDLVGTPMRQAVMSQLDGLTGAAHTHSGSPDWESWPNALSVAHQQMHITAIRRAYEGGLRLMFASATDNQTLSMLWHRNYDYYGNPVPAFEPTYDYESARRQIEFIRELAGRNLAWMQIVETPAQARTAIRAGKLALVLSLELDTLTVDQIRTLRLLGVRHVIPVHFADNTFGGTAVYGASSGDNVFNTANWFLNGRFFSVVGDPLVSYRLGRPQKLHYHRNDLLKGGAVEPVAISNAEYAALGYAGVSGGHRNARRANLAAIRQLMRLGLMIDVAHMSQNTTDDVLGEATLHGYPIMDSHTGVRADGVLGSDERALLESQVAAIRRLGGVIGIGTATRGGGASALASWASDYSRMRALLGGRGLALGTDLNGLQAQLTSTTVPSRYPIDVASRRAPSWVSSTVPPLAPYRLGRRIFDGNRDGLAHYGMIPELLQALESVPADPSSGRLAGTEVVDALFRSAEDVLVYWEAVEGAAAAL
jgi:microsomal dipeptidase-like Zn-dependent dipeptidase